MKEFFLQESGKELSLAQIYPEKFAVVGPVDAIAKLELFLKQEAISYEPYDLGLGLHAPLAESLVAPLHDYLEKIDIKTPEIPVISPLSGKEITTDVQLKEIAKTIFTQPVLVDKIIDRLRGADELLVAIPAQKIRASLEKLFEHKKLVTMETAAEFALISPAADTALKKEDDGQQS